MRMKLSPIPSVIQGKRVVLIDDSIVRGTTSRQLVSLLREAGAKEIHLRISAPPFLHPCYYGTDIDSEENLIASHHGEKEVATLIGADSLGYLPLECLHELTGTHSYCDACFSGKYATEIPQMSERTGFEQKIIREVKQMEKWNKKLLLEDGSQFYGYGFGSQEEKITEIVFNTAPVGYQEILSDPSYTYQTVVMAYPLIGNYGIAKEDFETKQPSIGGLAVRDYNDIPSNFRSAATLDEVMKQYHIPGIYGIDTRKLVRKIRDFGSCKALLTDAQTSPEEGLKNWQDLRFRKMP